jgi:peptidoglycan hydrolase CwlO-like protein
MELTDNGYQFCATRIRTTGWEISTRNIGSTKKAKEMPASDSDKTASEKAPDDIKSLQNKIEHLEELLKKKNEKIMAYAKHIGQLEERLKALEEKNSLSIQVA